MDSRAQTQPQKRRGKSNVPCVERTIWDSKNNSIFIKLCVEQVITGNRPTTHLSKLGWKNLLLNFQKDTGKLYEKTQLKNHWDVLKSSWICWKNLIRGESGLERDPATGVISSSDDWWRNKLQEYPECAKFRNKPLEYEDELEILFADVAASGKFVAYTPNSVVMPINNMADEENVNIQFSTPGVDRQDTNMEVLHPGQLTGKRCNSDSTRHGRCKKVSGAKQLTVESSSSNSDKASGTSISDCLDILGKLPGVHKEDDLYIWAARLFMYDVRREAFISLSTDDLRLRFLKLEIAVEKSRLPTNFGID